jgi:hypothetical protein
MKNVVPALTLTIGLLLFNCQKNQEDNEVTSPAKKHICVGTWQGGIGGEKLAGLLPTAILIDVTINDDADSTYSLVSTYAPGIDTTLKHTGTWHLNSKGDSIILAGNNCLVTDTTQGKLVSRECGSAIAIHINIQNNLWKVLMTDLLPVAKTLSIDISNPVIAAVAGNFEVELTKVEK